MKDDSNAIASISVAPSWVGPKSAPSALLRHCHRFRRDQARSFGVAEVRVTPDRKRQSVVAHGPWWHEQHETHPTSHDDTLDCREVTQCYAADQSRLTLYALGCG